MTTFARSVLDWSELHSPPHTELLRWYRDLIALRRTEPDLHDPAVPLRVWTDGTVIGVERGTFTLLVNLGPQRTITIPTGARAVLTDGGTDARDTEITLPEDGVALMRVVVRGESDA